MIPINPNAEDELNDSIAYAKRLRREYVKGARVIEQNMIREKFRQDCAGAQLPDLNLFADIDYEKRKVRLNLPKHRQVNIAYPDGKKPEYTVAVSAASLTIESYSHLVDAIIMAEVR